MLLATLLNSISCGEHKLASGLVVSIPVSDTLLCLRFPDHVSKALL